MELDNHQKLKNALSKFAFLYCENRYKFLYEVDAQVALSLILEECFYEPHLIRKERISHHSLMDLEEFNIGQVHREYPQAILFDNVILGKQKQIGDIKHNDQIFEAFYFQPVRYAIELKLVPLYQKGVLNADKSLGDYERFINEKLKKLSDHQEERLEYGIQLTLLQSIEEQEEFLRNHDPNVRTRWTKWFNSFQKSVNQHPNIEYCYVDLIEKKIKPVYE